MGASRPALKSLSVGKRQRGSDYRADTSDLKQSSDAALAAGLQHAGTLSEPLDRHPGCALKVILKSNARWKRFDQRSKLLLDNLHRLKKAFPALPGLLDRFRDFLGELFAVAFDQFGDPLGDRVLNLRTDERPLGLSGRRIAADIIGD